MSTSRRERREQERQHQKQVRKINWTEIKKVGKWMLLLYLALALLIAAINFYSLYSNNKERRKITADPANATAVINHIYNSKRSGHYASYTFIVAGNAYNGKTWKSYSGFVGDSVGITFNRMQPSFNILTRDLPEQTFRSVFKDTSLTIVSIIFLGFAIPLLWILFKVLTGDKELISEFTSKAE